MSEAVTGTPATRVIIADDHRIFREALRNLLEAENDLTVVGEAGDGDEAVRLSRDLRPDVLLLDVAMPGMAELDAIGGVVAASPNTHIILLTAGVQRSQMADAIELGVRGIVLKESATEVLLKAIRAVMSGYCWLGREIISDLMHDVLDRSERSKPRNDLGLTPRELQIIKAVVAAYSNKEIAQSLSISEKTVKHHLTNIFDKLGVSSRLEVALFALHHDLSLTD